jgi:hypothetical protein
LYIVIKEITEEKKLRIDTPRHGPAVKQHQNNSQKKITAAISVNEYDEKRTMPIKEGVVAARRKAFVPVERKFKVSFTGISSISRHLTGLPMLGRRNQQTKEPQKLPPGGATTTKIKKEDDEEQYHYSCETEIAAKKIKEEDEEKYIVI